MQTQYQHNPYAEASMGSLIAAYQQDFVSVQTDQAISWAKECQFAEQALAKNDYLARACSEQPNTLRNAIINVAAIGISLNPALKHAYLVPRKLVQGGPVQVCLDISYQGLLHLAVKEGAIEWGQAKLVYEKDVYTNKGADQQPGHEYSPFGDRGNVIGAYCTVKLPSGDYLTEEMSVPEIQQVASSSMAANGPWKKWWGQMARKTVIKRASNYWPKCDLVHEAVAVINQHEGLSPEFTQIEEKDITPVQTDSDTLNELLDDEPDDFKERLNNVTSLDGLATIGQEIAASGKGTQAIRDQYAQKREELRNVKGSK